MEKKNELKTNKLLVERETYEYKGKEYFTYFVKGVIRGKEVKANVVPMDLGGYTILDIVFNGAMKADLVATPFEMKDEKTGTIIKGNSFSVRSVDGNGEIYECKIKPFRQTDKQLLNMIIKL